MATDRILARRSGGPSGASRRRGALAAALLALWLLAPPRPAAAATPEAAPPTAPAVAAAQANPNPGAAPGSPWAARDPAAATASGAPGGNHGVDGPSFAPMGLALVAVLGAMAAVLWLLRRMGLAPRGTDGRLLRIVSQLSLGPRERVLIVEAGDRWLVLGVGSAGIARLGTLPRGQAAADGMAAAGPAGAAASFQNLLERLRKGGAA